MTKERIYKARRNLINLSTQDLGLIYNGPAQRIFITESLTRKNKDLFKEAYKVKKDNILNLSGHQMGKYS